MPASLPAALLCIPLSVSELSLSMCECGPIVKCKLGIGSLGVGRSCRSSVAKKWEKTIDERSANSRGSRSPSMAAGRPRRRAGACYIPSPGEMPGGVLLRKAKARIYPEVLKDAEGPLPAAASAPSSNPTSLSRQKVFELGWRILDLGFDVAVVNYRGGSRTISIPPLDFLTNV